MARAVALLCVGTTKSDETGKVRGLQWYNQLREGKGVQSGEVKQDRQTKGIRW